MARLFRYDKLIEVEEVRLRLESDSQISKVRLRHTTLSERTLDADAERLNELAGFFQCSVPTELLPWFTQQREAIERVVR